VTATRLNFVIPATPTAMVTVTSDVTQFLHRQHWSDDEVGDIDLALQEALANAIRHGCKGDPTKHVACSLTHEPSGEVTIVVRDEGPGFDLAAVPDPLEGDNLFKSSGRGVFLISQLMDEVAYADGGREVRMRKRRAPAVDRRIAA
jgi:serine/threonine-protein kinase RsbW